MKRTALKWVLFFVALATIGCDGKSEESDLSRVSATAQEDDWPIYKWHCTYKSMWNKKAAFTEQGSSREDACQKAKEKCEKYSGSETGGGCVPEAKHTGIDSPTGSADIISGNNWVCPWEEPQTNQSGYGTGSSRKEAHDAAEEDCTKGGLDHPPGIAEYCKILPCYISDSLPPS
jgi:hypothetical protein